MNEYNANNPSEMLHLLIDGELDNSMETSLYTSLLENEDLRNEMRELISLRESIRRDVEAFTPPISASQAVFTRLGYTAPIPPTVLPTSATSGFWGNIGHKLWNPVVTAVTASVITAIVLWNFSIGDNTSVVAQNSIKNNRQMPITQNMANETGSTETNTLAQSNSAEPVVKYVYITKYEKQPTENSEVAELPESNANTLALNELEKSENYEDQISFFPLDNVRYHPILSNNFNSSSKEFTRIDNFYPETEKEHALTLEFKVTSGNSYPNISMNTADGKLISNFSIGAFTPISKVLQIGLEAGKEPFGMEFWDIDDIDKRLYTIQQNPTLLWAGVGLKFIWDKHIEMLAYSQPFLHFTLASTSVGPLVKSNAGLQFVSESGLGILLGLEGSLLTYQNENKWYTSKNLGVMYGMFMRF